MLDGFGMLLKSMGIDPVALMRQFNEFEEKTKKVALDVAAKIDAMDHRLERIELLLMKRDADMQSHIQVITPAGDNQVDELVTVAPRLKTNGIERILRS